MLHNKKSKTFFSKFTSRAAISAIALLFNLSFAEICLAEDPCIGTSETDIFINTQYAAGLAAGNTGDYYNNCDDGHASLDITKFPQMGFIDGPRPYGAGPQAGKVIIGNASVAYNTTAEYGNWTSLTRKRYMSDRSTAGSSYNRYISNAHYWHPEHRDHDTKDLYHAMFPYVSNSQGSSGSELDEVKKYAYTLAAFRPDVKTKLKETGLLMPTIAMLFRRTRVADDAEYLTGKAHPSAFNNANNTLEMVKMANGITIDKIPPMIQINVIEDNYNGSNFTEAFESDATGHHETRLFDTPASIARIYRGKESTKYMVVSATSSYDVNNKPLTYHWKVLRGDPARVRITNLNPQGSVAFIEIDYHPETVIEGSSILTSLVVVGAFVHNGDYYSSPGYVTSYAPPTEERAYGGPNGDIEVTYNSNGYMYTPVSHNKSWDKDVFHYNSDGLISSFTRYEDATQTEYTPEGYIIAETDGSGIVTKGYKVVYRVPATITDGLEIISYPGTWNWTINYNYESVNLNNQYSISGDIAGYTTGMGQIFGGGGSQLYTHLKPKHGEVTLDVQTSEFVYTPHAGFSGVDRFTFFVLHSGSNEALVVRYSVSVNNQGLPAPEYPHTQQPAIVKPPDSETPGDTGNGDVVDVPDEDDPADDLEPDDIIIPEIKAVKCYNNILNPLKGGSAKLIVELPEAAHISLILYDTKGSEVKVLANETRAAGIHTYYWNGKDGSGSTVGSGIYFAHSIAGGSSSIKKIVVVK